MVPNEMDRTQKLSRANLPLKTIPLICSWCNKIYRIEQWKFEENQRTGVSHGICPECLSKMDGQLVEEELPADEGEEFVDDPEAGFPDELDASEDASFEDDGRTR